MSRIDGNKLANVDLNKPAFGKDAQTLDSLNNESNDTSVEETRQDIKEDESEGEENVEPVGENKVPYSRFKNIHQRALDAEAEADRWRARAEEIESSRFARREEETDVMPPEWRELYGNNEASQKAWNIQSRREQAIEQRAYEAGQRGAEELEVRQAERISSNVASIDENFEELSAYVGRDLTAKEQSAILDIVDEFTPEDSSGKYAGPILPFDKAWDIYELKNSTASSSRRQARDAVAGVASATSQGNSDSSTQAEADKNFNPLQRGTWRKRLGL